MGNEEREIMYADAGNGLEGDLTVENDGSQLHRTELKEQSKDWSEKIVLFLKKYLLYVGLISGAICLLSIILLIVCRTSNTPAHCEENCLKSDYTNCINSDDVPKTCADTLAEEKSQKECICYMKFNVTSLIKGNVTMYYHLDYDQTAYANSIDVDQLRGILSPKPSSNCGNYTYTPQGQPIAPCGELADSMFTDSFGLTKDNNIIDCLTTGLIDKNTKQRYRNPVGNLTEALKDFAKPRSWLKNIWELDTVDPENNGFQNEAFIAWMETGWSRKPVCRFNQTSSKYTAGLPVGEYKWQISYWYLPSRYNGTRSLLICGEVCYPETISTNTTLIVLLSMLIVICLPFFLYWAISGIILLLQRFKS